MKDLKVLYEELNFKDVITYIQSGNVVFKSSLKTNKNIADTIKQKIHERFGYDIPVIIRTPNEMQSIVKLNPFLKEKNIALERLYVTFLESHPQKEHLDKLTTYSYEPDKFIITGMQIYLYCPVGYGNSKLNNNFFENKLKLKATTRNWRTVNELLRLASPM